MNIRRASGILMIVAAIVVVGSWLTREESSELPKQRTLPRGERSVLLITVDTTRADHLEPYGAENVETPNLKRLGDRGVVFERAYSVAPITLVAHTSILSGLYPFEHGVRNNGSQYVSDEVTTLAEILRDQGYRTGAFVSASVLERRYGLDQGFEIYDDDLSAGRNRLPRMVADRPAEATIASASAWLEGLGPEEPFFLWIHLYDPHASYSPPPPFRDTYRQNLYDGEIAYMDEQIGRLLAHPRVLGDSSEQAPIITVLGDHGESLGEHGETTHAILAYDSTLHVPWLLYLPGGPTGVRVPAPVGQVDLVPTLLDLLGMEANVASSGRSLVPLLETGELAGPSPVAYYSETYLPFYTYSWAKLKVLRKGSWKFVDGPRAELFDLNRDPLELTNLVDQQEGKAHDMKRDLDEWLARVEDAELEAALPLDLEAQEKLRSLGYLSVGSGPKGGDEQRKDPREMIHFHVGLERARSLLSDRLYDQAKRQLEGILHEDPNNLAALTDLSNAQEGLKDLEGALRTAERALEIDPDYLRTYLTMARLEVQLGRADRALELVDLAILKDPNVVDTKIQKALLLARLQRPGAGREVLEQALVEHAEHPRLNVIYANRVELQAGDLEAAEKRIRSALDRDPFLSNAWFSLGQILERTNRTPEAADAYRKGLQRSPDDADSHAGLGLLLARTGEHEEAIQHLREAIRLDPNVRSELHVSLGGALAELGRVDEASREYEKVLAIDPGHPGARNNAAIALYRSGRLDEAEAQLQSLVADYPGHADAHNNLAAIAVERENWPEAVFHSRRTLELDPKMVQAWNNLGIGLEEQGESNEARKAYERALVLDPNYWPARFNFGILLRKAGDAKEAVVAFEEVLSRFPGHPDTHFELGALYAGPLHDATRARAHLNALLTHAPTHPKASEARQLLANL